jgi:hypothetical protein
MITTNNNTNIKLKKKIKKIQINNPIKKTTKKINKIIKYLEVSPTPNYKLPTLEMPSSHTNTHQSTTKNPKNNSPYKNSSISSPNLNLSIIQKIHNYTNSNNKKNYSMKKLINLISLLYSKINKLLILIIKLKLYNYNVEKNVNNTSLSSIA